MYKHLLLRACAVCVAGMVAIAATAQPAAPPEKKGVLISDTQRLAEIARVKEITVKGSRKIDIELTISA